MDEFSAWLDLLDALYGIDGSWLFLELYDCEGLVDIHKGVDRMSLNESAPFSGFGAGAFILWLLMSLFSTPTLVRDDRDFARWIFSTVGGTMCFEPAGPLCLLNNFL